MASDRGHDDRRRFLLDGTNVRGEIVRLDGVCREATLAHDYPAPIGALVGEALAATALLTATIDLQPTGSVTLQIQGSGAVDLLTARQSDAAELRALARWHGEVGDADYAELVGDAQLAITIDPGGRAESYQGLVEVVGGQLSESIEEYFVRSEQIPTRLWLVAAEGRAAGLLLQALPDVPVDDVDAWDRMRHLAASVTGEELLGLEPNEMLYRLFHAEEVRVFDPTPLRFRCGCDRQRIETVLRGLGAEDVRSIVAEHGKVEVRCEYCGQKFQFDAIDVETLFTATLRPEDPPKH